MAERELKPTIPDPISPSANRDEDADGSCIVHGQRTVRQGLHSLPQLKERFPEVRLLCLF